MTRTNILFVAILILLLSGCTNTEEEKESNDAPVMFPNYLVINAPSKDPDKPWYISDFFRRVEQWELEADIDLNELQLGMYELTQYPNQEPTQAHKNASDKLLEDSFNAAVRNGWLDKEEGLSDGYESMYGDPVHFVNVEYVFDGETLNPEKPEVLMYYETPEGNFLMGVMFLAIAERGPQAAGPLTKWHYHIDRRMCYEQGVLPIGSKNEDGSCEANIPEVRFRDVAVYFRVVLSPLVQASMPSLSLAKSSGFAISLFSFLRF